MANRRYTPKFQGGGYFGGESMKGEKGLDIRTLAKAMKEKEKYYQEAQAKRGKWRGISDLFETAAGFIPGVGKFIKPALNVLSEQMIQKGIDVEGGQDLSELETMWTAGEATAGQEEWEKIYEASDVSLGDALIGEATGFMKSKVGGDLLQGFGGDTMARTFGVGGEKFGEKVTSQGLADNPWLSEGYVDDWEQGGRVPKYQKGGLTPEIISQLIEKRYGTTDFDETEEMMRLDRKYGDPGAFRIRPSEVESLYQSNPEAQKKFAADMARIEERKSSESGLSGLIGKLLGRNKSKYAGGGMVQGGAPSIANYFSMQGKSLGGSDKQSLAEKLGRI